ncbi:hypothetical protein [Gordonia soli]|uniref:Uncharacterized protein n=1 Tax=Gordonia soli NBRC 108243 TaxID=1223545 RepID=M0QK71_9ACTN|nr:hypothetical protein [Gordonia soli]GAC68686.1 hypothetical protein GS4_17_00720 [Gordonia soli NBRC 108243]
MAKVSDSQIVSILDNAVAGINPVLDALSERDPLGLKGHTFRDKSDDENDSTVEHGVHLLSDAINVTDWPGTKGWSERSTADRADWWVTRIGTVNTAAVAYPGLFGAWAKRLPITSVLGFANQAMVLIAVAREYGVTDRARQVELLASVLCDRNLTADDVGATADVTLADDPKDRKKSLIRAVWDTAQTLRGLSDEFDRRPQPAAPFRLLSYIPVVGAPVTYVGERLALSKAAKEGRRWISAHPDAVSASTDD